MMSIQAFSPAMYTFIGEPGGPEISPQRQDHVVDKYAKLGGLPGVSYPRDCQTINKWQDRTIARIFIPFPWSIVVIVGCAP